MKTSFAVALLSIANPTSVQSPRVVFSKIKKKPAQHLLALSILVISLIIPSATMGLAQRFATTEIHLQTTARTARLQLQLGHSMSSMAYSPDGKTLASGGDWTVKLWDVSTGRLRATLEGHRDTVRTVAFSPDGRTLVSGSRATIRLWDPETGLLRAEWKSRERDLLNLPTVSFSPDGRTLALGNGDRIELWNVAEARQESYLAGHAGNVWSVAYSTDGHTIASGSDDGTIKIWDAKSGRLLRTFTGNLGRIYSVTFSPDSRTIVSAGQDKRVRLWDASDGQLSRILEGHSDSVYAVVFSRDGKLLASNSSDGTIKLWDPTSGNLRGTIQRSSSFGRPLALSPNGKLVASAAADGTVHQWNLRTKQLEFSPPGEYGSVSQLTFSPDGKIIAYLRGRVPSKLVLWNVGQGKLPVMLSPGADYVSAIAFSPDGRTLAAGTKKSLELWDVERGILQRSIEISRPISSITYIPGGKYLLTIADRKDGQLWDLQQAKLVSSLEAAHPFRGLNAEYSYATPTVRVDGKIVRLFDAPVRPWPPATNSIPDDLTRVAWSPTSQKIAVAVGSSAAGIWNASSGRKLAILVGHTDVITTVLFSPDGRTLATGSLDNTVRLWDAETGRLRGVFKGHLTSIDALMFTPDGRTVVSRSADTTRIWDTDSQRIHAILPGYKMDGDDATYRPDGKVLALVGYPERGVGREEPHRIIRLIEVATGKVQTTLQVDGVRRPLVTFSRDGSLVAVWSADRTVKLWDASTGRLLVSTQTDDDVASVVFSRDGRFLLAGDEWGAIKLWAVSVVRRKSGEVQLSAKEQIDSVTTPLLCTLVAFANNEWIVVTPDGRFDASTPWNSLGVHWVLGTRIITLEGAKKHSYSPGLLNRIWRSAADGPITDRP